MQVHLLAHTNLRPLLSPAVLGTPFGQRASADLVDGVASDIDLLGEFAGRACYQSWQLPNTGTQENEQYLANVIEHLHFSVLEHGSITVYITGVSRALTHELVRHRMLSFSQLSQRFVSEEDAEYVIPPAIRGNEAMENVVKAAWDATQVAYATLVSMLMNEDGAGLSRKQAREAARCVLPNMTETRIVVTGNVRAWREFVQKRYSPHADAEIQELAAKIRDLLRTLAPHSVSDL